VIAFIRLRNIAKNALKTLVRILVIEEDIRWLSVYWTSERLAFRRHPFGILAILVSCHIRLVVLTTLCVVVTRTPFLTGSPGRNVFDIFSRYRQNIRTFHTLALSSISVTSSIPPVVVVNLGPPCVQSICRDTPIPMSKPLAVRLGPRTRILMILEPQKRHAVDSSPGATLSKRTPDATGVAAVFSIPASLTRSSVSDV